ncbi:DUF333 domain-containing protein [Brucella intermedia]|uniref:putative hemolysin n=1 Tax=Brucella TaxID=234 RepID=UPI00094624BF
MRNFIVIMISGLMLAGCVPEYENRPVTTTTTFPAPGPAPVSQGSGNPASQYCVRQGGRVEIRKEFNGDVGYCHTSDGRVLEEWTYFRSQQQGEYTPPPPPPGS